MMRTATEWVPSLKDLSLRNFMWKQVPMANSTNRDTGEYESGMTRGGSVICSPYRDNIGIHTWAVVLKFFVERTYFTKSLMSTKKQLNIIVNNKQRN